MRIDVTTAFDKIITSSSSAYDTETYEDAAPVFVSISDLSDPRASNFMGYYSAIFPEVGGSALVDVRGTRPIYSDCTGALQRLCMAAQGGSADPESFHFAVNSFAEVFTLSETSIYYGNDASVRFDLEGATHFGNDGWTAQAHVTSYSVTDLVHDAAAGHCVDAFCGIRGAGAQGPTRITGRQRRPLSV